MFNITGKLSNGKSFRAQVPATDAAKAVETVTKNLPEGSSINSMTIKPAEAGGFIKFAKPRKTKAESNGAAPAAAAAAPAATTRKR